MPTIGSITKTVRINAEDLAVIEGIMAKERITWSGAIHYLARNVGTPSKISEKNVASPNKDLEEIDSMARFFGLTGEGLLKEVCEGLTEGNLTVENGKIVGTPKINLDDFIDTCHEMAVDPQKILEKATQCLKRGQL